MVPYLSRNFQKFTWDGLGWVWSEQTLLKPYLSRKFQEFTKGITPLIKQKEHMTWFGLCFPFLVKASLGSIHDNKTKGVLWWGLGFSIWVYGWTKTNLIPINLDRWYGCSNASHGWSSWRSSSGSHVASSSVWWLHWSLQNFMVLVHKFKLTNLFSMWGKGRKKDKRKSRKEGEKVWSNGFLDAKHDQHISHKA